jgi:FkbM family methyltransferase
MLNKLISRVNSAVEETIGSSTAKFLCSHGYVFYARVDDYWRFINHFEPKTTKFLARVAKSDDIVIDVGAHIGLHTIHLAKMVKYVYAIEPEPRNLALLKMNLLANNISNTTVVPVILSDYDGYKDLYISRKLSGAHTVEQAYVRTHHVNKLRLPSRRLDTLIKMLGIDRVDVVKIDVEGHETKVISGMKNILKNNPPRILVIETKKNGELLEDLKHAYDYRYVIELDDCDSHANYAFLKYL